MRVSALETKGGERESVTLRGHADKPDKDNRSQDHGDLGQDSVGGQSQTAVG